MAGIKIVNLPSLGRNLINTDLLELSLVGGSGSRKITGQEILSAARSGKQDDITLTTTGASGASTFIANTLNVPTYSLSGLGGVPTTRTLTINGTTQDLSADRTFTISTGITIGTTAIASGTVGRVLFEGTGNVVQESANLFWDNTNGRLGIGTSSPISKLHIVGDTNVIYQQASTTGFTGKLYYAFKSGGVSGEAMSLFGDFVGGVASAMAFSNASGTTVMQIRNGGNVQIGTTTDAGFKLDVNGTARVTGTALVEGSFTSYGNISAAGNLGGVHTFGSGGTYTGANGVVSRGATTSVNTPFVSFNTSSPNANSNTSSQKFGGYGFVYDGASQWFQGVALSFLVTTGPDVTSQAPFEAMRLTSVGNLVLGTITNVASSKLTINSTTQGFLPPRMTNAQRAAIASPAVGLIVYCTDSTEGLYVYKSTGWTFMV